MVVHNCNTSIQEAEEGGSQDRDQPESYIVSSSLALAIYSETLSKEREREREQREGGGRKEKRERKKEKEKKLNLLIYYSRIPIQVSLQGVGVVTSHLRPQGRTHFLAFSNF
jgi:hypothetical protein